MANSTLDITQTFDLPQKLLKVVDNGDGTYSIAVSALSPALPSGAATAANQSPTQTKRGGSEARTDSASGIMHEWRTSHK